MAADHPDRKINTDEKVRNDGARRLPHERDQSPDAQNAKPRPVMEQAASDLEQGLVDTDLHGERGVEQAKPAPAGQAVPDPHLTPKKAR
ncbi:hypothetical protein [Janthinobacterium agaricidamnosum]|uniref:Uncharacterized protein n=1 Tax=Janthinobacterium agaricidamnosum NBRC 102515 = DSM 9628 TaxID=1349767 RepID=W0V0K3_9BURK|nr:hypothetical protein [Janthinobacterium agaricidamnosum]CDG81125.1 hypothetical protein GJA_465 [Janthinobacterium agaricidamnosum NBRC 102515 = DSM 9628]